LNTVHHNTSDEQESILLLGSNMGNRKGFIADAVKLITDDCGTVLAQSGLYETAAWGNTAQPPYLNCALHIKTRHEASRLIEKILAIEKTLGRTRHQKWEQRIIDIDIIFYGNKVIDTPQLKVPHPLMHQRRFVLAPVCEITPDFLHPVLTKTCAQLLTECEDKLVVKLFPAS
jgi:2-amino-4-hydroxy-6-hydroxymethyldihydropteridine diphosphokinase